MVAAIQKLTNENQDRNLKSFVVFTAGPEWKGQVEKLAADHKISIPMTLLPGGTSSGDFQSYKISPEVRNTIILYKGKKVQHNFVDVTDAQKWSAVEKATAQLVGK